MKNFQVLVLFGMLYGCVIILTILHEIGHALAAGFFTSKEVTVFFGSHGQMDGSFKIKIGKRYTCYISKNIFRWKGGLCICYPAEMTFGQHLIQIIAGPLLPLLLSICLHGIALQYSNGYSYGFTLLLVIFSLFSFIFNLAPDKKAIQKVNGSYLSNDGQAVIDVIKYRRDHVAYWRGFTLFNEKNYDSALLIFSGLIKKYPLDAKLIRYTFSAALLVKNLEIAGLIIKDYIKILDASATDYVNIGYYYILLDDPEKALDNYTKALDIERSWHALNNAGYTFLIMDDYQSALELFDEAILKYPPHGYTYNNRGLAKIKLGRDEEGLQDLIQGHELEPLNSYYYKNMGIYYFDRAHYKDALVNFEKAKELDPSTYKIDYYINSAKLLPSD